MVFKAPTLGEISKGVRAWIEKRGLRTEPQGIDMERQGTNKGAWGGAASEMRPENQVRKTFQGGRIADLYQMLLRGQRRGEPKLI